jgi:molybdopterin-containing oxidoreductase family iron-sulfur binding subunit
MKSAGQETGAARYGMVVDLDRCNGCGACVVACAVENNVPPAAERATERNGIAWMRVDRVGDATRGQAAYVPMMCQHCGDRTPCASVCPQNAVEVDPASGIVAQVPVRCLGCRYCMAACPYHARSFNWWDPQWPGGIALTLNPDVSTRTRGVVEKCTLCAHRLQEARQRLAAEGKDGSARADYVPACVEACPARAITFGDLADASSEVSRLAHDSSSFRPLERLGTGAAVYYRTERDWVRRAVDGAHPRGTERHHG